MKWVQLEHSQHPSPLDMHLYETYADNCVKMGNSQEGIQTLQSLVRRNPGHLSGWLRLASLLLETWQVQHAVTTMQKLTALHPSYKEGQATLQHLLAKCKKEGTTTQYQPLELEKV